MSTYALFAEILYTLLVSFGLAIYVLVSAFIGHMQFGDLNQSQHFMKNMDHTRRWA